MHPRELEGLSRTDLIDKAAALGVDKADLLTRSELADEIVRRTVTDPIERRIARGLLGIARDLVARVVERGLHLPDAAARIRGSERPSWMPVKPPIATVTLAEIYAAQGHRSRALSVLDEVLENESDHVAARSLRDQIATSEGDEPVALSEGPPAIEVPVDRGSGVVVSSHETPRVEPATSEAPEVLATHEAPAPDEAPVSNEMLPSSETPRPQPGPLPERYDRNKLVLTSVDPKTVVVRWEIRHASIDDARKRAGDGSLLVRLVAVNASWEGPIVEIRDVRVDAPEGEWCVREVPLGAVLRAAIGWSAGTEFEPIGVAMDVTEPPDAPVARETSRVATSSWSGMDPSLRHDT